MSDITKNLKPVWENLTFPLVEILSRLKVHPNFLTVLGVILTVFSVPFIATGKFFIGGLIVLAGAVCDALDGHLARTSNKVSKFGALLDSTLDRVGDFLPLLGLALYFAEKPLWLVITLFNILFWFLVSYIRARIEGLGFKGKLGGFFERPERVAVLVISLFLNMVEIGLLITLVGSVLTSLQRLKKGYEYLN